MAQSTVRRPAAAPKGPGVRATPVRHGPSNALLKVVMALTGAVFTAFVFVHMIGNLKVYQGAEHFNAYAHWLRAAFEPVLPHEGLLWILRAFLLLCLVGHVWAAALIVIRARRARGPHPRRRIRPGSWLTRAMPTTGVVLLLFLVFHVLDLTLGARPAAPDAFQAATPEASSAYANVIASFSRWPASLVYILAMLALAAHLIHGIVAMVADLGIAGGPRFWGVLKLIALVLGLVIAIGNITIPLAVLTGALA